MPFTVLSSRFFNFGCISLFAPRTSNDDKKKQKQKPEKQSVTLMASKLTALRELKGVLYKTNLIVNRFSVAKKSIK